MIKTTACIRLEKAFLNENERQKGKAKLGRVLVIMETLFSAAQKPNCVSIAHSMPSGEKNEKSRRQIARQYAIELCAKKNAFSHRNDRCWSMKFLRTNWSPCFKTQVFVGKLQQEFMTKLPRIIKLTNRVADCQDQFLLVSFFTCFCDSCYFQFLGTH